ncbi:MAG: TlpA family protein disulfide reductase [Opitutae bacterium]|nr:TlpA family protein disulfide reductase [Opitutae bacterium]
MRLSLLFVLLAAAVSCLAAEPAADRAWAEFEKIRDASMPANATKAEKNAWWDRKVADLERLGAAFLDTYPQDPRRWAVAVHLREVRPWPVPDTVPPAFNARVRQLAAEAVDRSDVPTEIRGTASVLLIDEEAARCGESPTAAQLLAIQRRLDDHVARFGANPELRLIQLRTLERLEGLDPAAAGEIVERLAASPHALLREVATRRQFLRLIGRAPFELRFIALDGREVDFQQLRGKVVLLDFWATWCQPCVVELPRLKQLRDEHGAAGLEIVGVSLDRPGTRGKLETFIRQHGLTWPQHFLLNGEGRNELAERFAITSIPAVFLFDRTGRLAVANVPPERLDAEVGRLLRGD